GVLVMVHRCFWLSAGHGRMRRRAVHVLPPIGIFWRAQVSLLRVTPLVGASALFLRSPDERRIRSIGTRGGRSRIWQKPGTCCGNLIAWFRFTFHTPSLRNS